MSLKLAFAICLAYSLGALCAEAKRSGDKKAVGAIYMISNDLSSNNVVTHGVYQDGTVAFAGLTPTRGQGSRLPIGLQLSDALASQGSIIVSDNYLFTVNAGSNTVVMFTIDPSDPSKLSMVGEPVGSGGNFPTSIDRSSATGNICVMNAGVPDNIQCFSVNARKGLSPIIDSVRTIDIPNSVPLGRLSQLSFTPDGSHLLVHDKGNLQSPGIPGHLLTYRVGASGNLSAVPVISIPPNASPPYASYGFIPIHNRDDAYIFAQPYGGYGTYEFKNGFNAPATVKSYTIDGQNTTCWVTYSEQTDSYYLTDTDDSKMYEVQLDEDLKPTLVKTYYNSSMPVDLMVTKIKNRDFLYVNGAGAVTLDVYKLSTAGKARLMQKSHYQKDVRGLGQEALFNYVQGMAVYLKD